MPKVRMAVVALTFLLLAASAYAVSEPTNPANSSPNRAGGTPATGVARQKAEELFRRYASLEHNFDPKMADLYSDSAKIVVTRVFEKGSKETRTIPAAEYKNQIRKVLPLAAKLRDLSFYTEEQYLQEGSLVRIKVKRYAELYKFTSPVELVVGPGPGADWLIFEEDSEQHPKSAPPPIHVGPADGSPINKPIPPPAKPPV
jgi:hypothetical protein